MVSPGLTVMAQPTYEIGVAACEILLARIAGRDTPPAHRRLPTALVERESVAAPAR